VCIERKDIPPKNAINPSPKNFWPRSLVVVARRLGTSVQIVRRNPNSCVATVMQKVTVPGIVLYLPPSPHPQLPLRGFLPAHLVLCLRSGVDE
jgi:hypothetical protein